MSNPNLATAEVIASKLGRAEADVSKAFESLAALVAFLPQARNEAGLAPTVGHALLTEGSSALMQLSQAQGGLSALHTQIAAIGRKMGVDVSASGPLQKEPQEPGSLSLVKAA